MLLSRPRTRRGEDSDLLVGSGGGGGGGAATAAVGGGSRRGSTALSHLMRTTSLVADEVKSRVVEDVSALASAGVRGVRTVGRGLRIITMSDKGRTSSGHVTFTTLQAAADASQVSWHVH